MSGDEPAVVTLPGRVVENPDGTRTAVLEGDDGEPDEAEQPE